MSSLSTVNPRTGSIGVPTEATRPVSREWLAICALLLVYFGIWLYLTPYPGITHDSQAYAFEALARLNPVPFSQDLFLQYRSQEEFTIFPWLYSIPIQHFGFEATASTLVFVCHLLWYGFAFLLLRKIAGTTLAFFSLGLLISMAGNYGGLRVFHIAEPFMTARLPAEVVSLAAIWLYLIDRKLPAVLLTAIAVAIHPLMAFPVAAFLICIEVAKRGPWYSVPVLLILGAVAAISGSFLLGGEHPLMTERWLAISRARSSFLFVDAWRPLDWNDTLMSLLTLGMGGAAVQSLMARRVAGSALGIGLAGLLLAAAASLWLPLEVLIQGQPWRWLWVSRFFAIGLLPLIVFSLWTHDRTGRGCALLLVAAWIFVIPVTTHAATVLMSGTVLTAIALVGWLSKSRLTGYERIVLAGAWLVFGTVAISSLITMSLTAAVMASGDESIQSVSTRIADTLKLLTPAIAIAVGACAIARASWGSWRVALLGAVGVTLIATAAPDAWTRWTEKSWSGSAYDEFADWRHQVPIGSEVLWYNKLRETWFLLERRSYLTQSQAGGVVFSTALAEEIIRRALVLEPYIHPNFWIVTDPTREITPNDLSHEVMDQICRDPELGYVVSAENIGSAIGTKEWPSAGEDIYLYDCGRYRGGNSG